MKIAYLDKNGVAIGYGFLKDDAIVGDDMIQVESDFDTANKRWNGESWEEYTPPEPPAPEPTQLDRIESNTNAIMEKESSLDVLLGVSE